MLDIFQPDLLSGKVAFITGSGSGINQRIAERPEGQASWDRILRHIPSRRAASRDEVAALALFLASTAGQYINGTVIPIDGGQTVVGSHAFGSMLEDAVRKEFAQATSA
jgi:NAD(P)-dependent dehydrogenase (short-subunit alcohol dehydrogenase family)